MASQRTGAEINPTLKKVVDGGPFNNQPLDVNNHLCSVSGLPQDKMATGTSDPLYRIDPSPNCPVCPVITLAFDIENESTTTATALVTPTGGTGPYTYAWSNGQTTALATGLTKNVAYTVIVTDANSCQVSGTITPNVQILTGLRLEMLYFQNNTSVTTDLYYPRLCFGAHTCNQARFEMFANGVSQGIANLNNNNGTIPPDIDEHNLPPGSYDLPTAQDRYFLKIITGADAGAIAGPGGTVDISITYIGTGVPHSDACWVRISKEDGTVLASTCMTSFTGYTFDPYA